jgi:hypothetical protein
MTDDPVPAWFEWRVAAYALHAALRKLVRAKLKVTGATVGERLMGNRERDMKQKASR